MIVVECISGVHDKAIDKSEEKPKARPFRQIHGALITVNRSNANLRLPRIIHSQTAMEAGQTNICQVKKLSKVPSTAIAENSDKNSAWATGRHFSRA
jgi:hypothetical protein